MVVDEWKWENEMVDEMVEGKWEWESRWWDGRWWDGSWWDDMVDEIFTISSFSLLFFSLFVGAVTMSMTGEKEEEMRWLMVVDEMIDGGRWLMRWKYDHFIPLIMTINFPFFHQSCLQFLLLFSYSESMMNVKREEEENSRFWERYWKLKDDINSLYFSLFLFLFEFYLLINFIIKNQSINQLIK